MEKPFDLKEKNKQKNNTLLMIKSAEHMRTFSGDKEVMKILKSPRSNITFTKKNTQPLVLGIYNF